MKKVEAIIDPFKLDEVKEALARAGIEGFIVSAVRDFRFQKGPTESYRGGKHVTEGLPQLKIETLVNDYKAVQTVEVIRKAAHTGHIGDGKILVSPVDEVVRIRTGERGSHAI